MAFSGDVSDAQHHRLVAGALSWWHDAGVDAAIGEVPCRWLETKPQRPARPASPAAAAAPPAPPPTVLAMPDTLDDFVGWLATVDLPGLAPPARRLAPAGPAGAALMILTDMPETSDVESGRWFSGELEQLFDRMLAALGETRDSVYLAALSPSRPPGGQIDPAMTDALATIARRHIALACPKRLWLMGKTASCAILGMSDADARGRLHALNTGAAMVPTIATAHPRLFASTPKRKSAAWAEMQRLLN